MRRKQRTMTLERALEIVRGSLRGSVPLERAATRLHGVPVFGQLAANDDGHLGQAYRDIEADLPADRDFTVEQWVEATHERHEQNNADDVWKARKS